MGSSCKGSTSQELPTKENKGWFSCIVGASEASLYLMGLSIPRFTNSRLVNEAFI